MYMQKSVSVSVKLKKAGVASAILLMAGAFQLQAQDTRAVLDRKGYVKEFSVAPDGKVWMSSSLAHTYYLNDIDSGWHAGPAITPQDITVERQCDRISFFNQDTAIITGYITSDTSKSDWNRNGYLRTTDGGKSWKLFSFSHHQWIYDAFVNNAGYAWIGGSDGVILCSEDFGASWHKLNSPYNASSRMGCIFMLNERSGISAGLGNLLHITSDNWSSNRQIPTPHDQKHSGRPGLERDFDPRIGKVAVWRDRYVVSQKGRVFWTDLDTIDWKPIPHELTDFAVDGSNGILYGIDRDSNAILVHPNGIIEKAPGKLDAEIKDIKVSRDILYVLDERYQLHKIDGKSHKIAGQYTTDYPIATPKLVRQGRNIRWGFEQDQLYIAAGKNGAWYREAQLPIDIDDFQLLNDSVAVIWDGNSNSAYDLKLHKLEPFVYKEPLAEFLKSPVNGFTIEAVSSGCFHYEQEMATYEFDSENQVKMISYISKEKHQRTKTLPVPADRVLINRLLSEINKTPDFIPSISDFKITAADKERYKKMIRKEKDESDDDFENGSIPQSYLENFSNSIDTVSKESVSRLLTTPEEHAGTNEYRMSVIFYNEAGDSIQLRTRYHWDYKPSGLPWTISYKDRNFNYYHPVFSAFVFGCMPEKFLARGILNNEHAIRAVAKYMYRLKLKEQGKDSFE